MNALIIDDEIKAREMLQFLLEKYVPEIEQIKLAHGASQATEIIETFQPNIVFLDIMMPDVNGFDWLKAINRKDFTVIFTTAYDKYAIQAIRFSAFDYLLKPIDAEDLRHAMDRYLDEHKTKHLTYDNLFYNTEQKLKKNYKLTINTTEGIHYLDPLTIMRCEADGNYTTFYINNKNKIVSSKPIGYYSELLEDFHFIRCHKSHIVNAHFVRKYSDFFLTIEGMINIEISRRRKKVVKEKMHEYFELKR